MKFGEIIKYLPGLSIILIFISYLKLQFFYGNFGIQIQEYMDSGELVLSFLPDIYEILITLICVIIMIGVVFPKLTEEADFGDSERSSENSYRKKRLGYYFRMLKLKKLKRLGWNRAGVLFWRIITNYRFIAFVLLTIVSVLQYLYGDHTCQEKVLEEFDISILMAWGLFFVFVLIDNARIYGDLNIFYAGMLSVVVFVSIITVNRKESCRSEEIKSGKSSLLLEFQSSGKMIHVRDSIIYIGGTRNYLFCYDLTNLETLIFDKRNIDMLKVKKNE